VNAGFSVLHTFVFFPPGCDSEQGIGAAEQGADLVGAQVATATSDLFTTREENECGYTSHIQRLGPESVVLNVDRSDVPTFLS
jgi:hypothetical protein